MSKIEIVDSTLRDGVQSLWALRIRTEEILPVARDFDNAGFNVIDITGTGFTSFFAKQLREDPWVRVERLKSAIKNTPLQCWMRTREINDFGGVPKSRELAKLWIKEMANCGINRMVFLESENDFGNIPELIQFAHSVGVKVIVPIMFSISPYHTYEYYKEKARVLSDLGADAIEIKDQGGLLTPESTKWFVQSIKEGVKGAEVQLEFQTHCTTGLGMLSSLAAIEEGVHIIRTCIPPLAEGSSLPNAITLLNNARSMGFSDDIDRGCLERISEHLTYVAKRESLPVGAPVEYDVFQYEHQVPGGVKATLKWQLSQLGRLDVYDDVLHETIRVRQDLGYPIMVTPASQYIVAQATINVLSGERYKKITDEIMAKAILPSAVPPPGPVSDELLSKIKKNPRAEQILKQGEDTVSLDELRERLSATNLSDREFLSRSAIQPEDLAAVKSTPLVHHYPTGHQPLKALLQEILSGKRRSVYIKKDDISIRVE